MDSLNPYVAPAVETTRSGDGQPPRLGLSRAFTIVAATAGGSSAIGGALGCFIGVCLPDYYHAVYGNSSLNTVQVGVGLGVTQGLGAGLALGMVVVLAVAISIRRRS